MAPMPAVANGGPGFLHVEGTNYEGVISSAGGPWTPSPQQVADLEAVLGPAIAAHALGKAFPPSQLKREYTGEDVGGVKIIRIQLACRVDADWMQKGLPSMKGGGTCYGWADFDVATGKLTRLDANAAK